MDIDAINIEDIRNLAAMLPSSSPVDKEQMVCCFPSATSRHRTNRAAHLLVGHSDESLSQFDCILAQKLEFCQSPLPLEVRVMIKAKYLWHLFCYYVADKQVCIC